MTQLVLIALIFIHACDTSLIFVQSIHMAVNQNKKFIDPANSTDVSK